MLGKGGRNLRREKGAVVSRSEEDHTLHTKGGGVGSRSSGNGQSNDSQEK